MNPQHPSFSAMHNQNMFNRPFDPLGLYTNNMNNNNMNNMNSINNCFNMLNQNCIQLQKQMAESNERNTQLFTELS